MRQELELLAPAGTFETLKAVIHAGADAVYFGGSRFGARAYAGNFNREEALEAIDFGHVHDCKVILAVNTLLKERELEEQLYEYLLPYYEQGLDAVIVQDFGAMQFIRRNFPKLPIHTSTQMTVTNASGAKFLMEQGAKRVVLARELSLREIEGIHRTVPVELEGFVHGALCYCYSGQCLFSSMLGGRSGNRGRCAQPCRLPYEVYDTEKRRYNNKNSLYPLSLKDLCTIEELPKLAQSGIYSFKIEGRMKSAEYAAGVVSVYRKYMDRYLDYGEEGCLVSKEDNRKLLDFGNRSGFTKGYYGQWNGPGMLTIGKPGHERGDDGLFEQIREAYIRSEQKEKIQGSLVVKKDVPVTLTVCRGDARVTVSGAVPLPAEKQSVTEEEFRRKMQKTGNTPFVFETLEITVEDGLFVPISGVNALRREALEELQRQLVQNSRRTSERPDSCAGNAENLKQEPGNYAGRAENMKQEDMVYSASIERKEQLAPLLEFPLISRIYADSIAFRREELVSELSRLHRQTESAGKKLYYILPAIFREHTLLFYDKILSEMKVDGFLVKSYDALAFLLERHVPPESIRIDHSLYTWSDRSRDAFLSLGLAGDTVPLELNRREILARKNEKSEMLLYGRLPLMTSVQCVNKSFFQCDKSPKIYDLKDRYGIFFPVKNHCMECYNVIYNSRPLYLFPVFDELSDSGIRSFRLSFTLEDAGEVAELLGILERTVKHGNGPHASDREAYTYGHYRRGVE